MSTIRAMRSSAISLALASCVHNSALPDDAYSLRSGSVTVSGRVTNSEGGPVSGASVSIPTANQNTISDADGRYTLSNIPPGPSGVVVSREGYATATTAGKFSTKRSDEDRNRVDVKLLTPDQVATLSTRDARDSAVLERNGFLGRQASLRDAYFLTPAQIDEIQPKTISDIFRRVPFVIETSGPSSSLLRASHACFVTYLDGMIRRVNAPSELETFVSPRNVMAAEVYPPGELPPVLFARAASRPGCTTVAVWTRT
jgi:hypothetical protein